MKELLHVTSPLDHLPQVGTKVCFRSPELEQREFPPSLIFLFEFLLADETRSALKQEYGLVPTVHAHGKITVGAMIVRETRTSVVVLWQDGEVKKERTTELLPYINIDEYDCW